MNDIVGQSGEFDGFVGRDDDLRALIRFNIYTVMLYRTNLYTHSHRVAAIVRVLNPVAVKAFGDRYDPRKAQLIAYVHDDPELIFGDVQAGNKSKMTAAQLQEVMDAEMRAIDEIAKRFPETVGGYSYKQLLTEAADQSSLESHVVSYADKYDALGEALHEVYSGNPCFITHVENEYGTIPTPPEYYAGYFRKFFDKFPDMRPLLDSHLPLLEPVPDRDYSDVVSSGKLHTLESLSAPTDNHHYDTWRQIVMSDTNEEVVRDLYVQKEFLG